MVFQSLSLPIAHITIFLLTIYTKSYNDELNAEKENAQRLRKQNQFIDPIKSKNYTKEQTLNFRNEIETKIFGNSTGTIPDR